MSLNPAQTLSLLQSMLREPQSAADGKRTTSAAFANRLDQALERGEVPTDSSPESIQRAAETLRLTTLRSSLELLDDQPSPSGGLSLPLPATSQQTLPTIQAYLANQTQQGTPAPPSVTMPATTAQPTQEAEEPGPAPLSRLSLLRDTTAGTTFEPIIQKASRQYGVDAELIRAVIKAESNFNPRAVSHAGAQGLMQLMPATARGLGVSNSFDPEQNVMGGTRFLKGLLDRYNGDLDAALAAYNWGPGNVDRRPDRLPRETRDYLVKVKQFYASYTG
ncbi:MAG: lytic transglycosylase domain-containing protein [Geobacter sp.]|uniref:lytic transglycosylase domain-containing protein n=1 Tax=Trichlorobacter sp. TaxID=2911007 RepID=UPI002A35D54B|nr:lytic transglycosylase domain-containing protein [Trichlorobacter sp.]MDY0385328.1 lytic transglycosylase domain-containing protein [Trichlorobacter sp.]